MAGMPRLPDIPDLARHGPFTRDGARAAGVSDRRLQGKQFERLHPGVWRWSGYEMSEADWLSRVEIAELCRLHVWRPGTRPARAVLPHLDAASRSPKESQLRAFIVAAGLPVPQPNVPIPGPDGRVLGIGDLWFPRWRVVVEYEGRQHAEDRAQLRRDIERYAGFRDHDVSYVQITGSMIANPVGAVHRVHAGLVRRGYQGPPPRFGARWGALFQQVG